MAPSQNSLVSVITPVFNAAPYLATTIESCLKQTYGNLELLVVDDRSADAAASTPDRFTNLDPRVRVFSGPNGGISAARNRAFENANGEFIALLDSDDMWTPDFLGRQLSTLSLHPDVDAVTSNAINLGGTFDGWPYWPLAEELRPISMHEIILRENAVHIFPVFRRSMLERIGGFDPSFDGSEDYRFWLRAAAAGCRFLADFTPRGYSRRRAESSSPIEQRMLKGMLRILQEIQPICQCGSPEADAIHTQLTRFSRQFLIGEARESISAGDTNQALTFLKQIPEKDRGPGLSALLRVADLCPSLLSYTYGTSRFTARNRRQAGRP